MSVYLSTFITGLGEIIVTELQRSLRNFKEKLLLDGLVVFETNSSVPEIRKLRFLNNSFLLLKQFENLSLVEIGRWVLKNPAQVKATDLGRTFRIVFSKENELVSVDKSLLKKLEEEISQNFNLSVDRSNPDTEFWFLERSEGCGFFGIRLTNTPITRKS